MRDKKDSGYFDRQETIRKLWILLYAACGLTVIPDFFTHKEPHVFSFDDFFGFKALLGFVSCAVLILFSKVVGLILKAKEDYYDQ